VAASRQQNCLQYKKEKHRKKRECKPKERGKVGEILRSIAARAKEKEKCEEPQREL